MSNILPGGPFPRWASGQTQGFNLSVEEMGGFPKIRGTFGGFPKIRGTFLGGPYN